MRTAQSTENGLIVVDTDKEEILLVTDNDLIVRVYLFEDRIIISHPNKDNILITRTVTCTTRGDGIIIEL